jgi:hypothetical protein
LYAGHVRFVHGFPATVVVSLPAAVVSSDTVVSPPAAVVSSDDAVVSPSAVVVSAAVVDGIGVVVDFFFFFFFFLGFFVCN